MTSILKTIPKSWTALGSEFFARPAPLVARELLGCVLLRRLGSNWAGGIITETEAYTEDDEASHSFRGQTSRNASMYGDPGVVYVYRSYGIHFCLNISTAAKGRGEAVLIRALSSDFSPSLMLAGAHPSPLRLCSGPGRLCAALAIDMSLDGQVLGEAELGIWRVDQSESTQDYEPVATTRVGISKAVAKPWRFGLDAHPSLSRPLRPKTAKKVSAEKEKKSMPRPKT